MFHKLLNVWLADTDNKSGRSRECFTVANKKEASTQLLLENAIKLMVNYWSLDGERSLLGCLFKDEHNRP